MSVRWLSPSGGTSWIFVSDSDDSRHIYDIVHGVDVLRARGASMKDVHVFTDNPAASVYLAAFGIKDIRPVVELETATSTLDAADSVAVVVTGHGRFDGIGTTSASIKPARLLQAVRKAPGVKCGVIVLGQCYAGVFHFLDAAAEPPLAVLGATNLNASLSAPISLATPILQEDGSPALSAWSANIFLFFFFEWLRNPQDVDGDSELTVADAFKFAGTLSNERLAKIKCELYLDAAAQLRQVESLRESFKTKPSLGAALAVRGAEDALDETLGYLHLHQEPWLLNAHLAREVRFKF